MAAAARAISARASSRFLSTLQATRPASTTVSKIGGKGYWTGDELLKSPWWGTNLESKHLAELDAALQHAKSSGIEWDGEVPLNVSKKNFPLEATGDLLAAMSDELEDGKGATMLQGMPVDKYSIPELSVMYAGICSYVGNIVLQSSSGLRSKSRGYGLPIGQVKAEMRGKTPRDGKQSNNYFRLHTDRCDLITLMSVRTSSVGGLSRVASAVAIHDHLVERSLKHASLLYQPIERIWEGGSGVIALPIWAIEPNSGKFTTQISPSYIENAQYVNGVRKLHPDEVEAIDLIEEIGLELGHEFLQMPGQITFMNNHLVYHGRTAWKFSEATDEDNTRDNEHNGRLLLRAWVSPYNSRPLPDTVAFNEMWGTVEAGQPRGGLEPAMRAGIKEKASELIEAYVSGKADYYGLYKRKFDGENVNL